MAQDDRTAFEKLRDWGKKNAVWIGGSVFGLCSVCATFMVAAYVYPSAAKESQLVWLWRHVWIGFVGLIVFLVAVSRGWCRRQVAACGTTTPNPSGEHAREFHYAKIWLAIALLWLGMLVSAAFSGFACGGRLNAVFPLPGEPPESERSGWREARARLVLLETDTSDLVEEISSDAEAERAKQASALNEIAEGLSQNLPKLVAGDEAAVGWSTALVLKRRVSDAFSAIASVHEDDANPDRVKIEESLRVVDGFLDELIDPESTDYGTHSDRDLAARMIVSVVLAAFGALFFLYRCANEKAKAGTEVFEKPRFVSGLLFRIGEAVLFTILTFLILRSEFEDANVTVKEFLLPLIALLIGMFVKTAETLFGSLGDRILKTVVAVLPSARDEGQSRESLTLDEWLKAIKMVPSSELIVNDFRFTITAADYSSSKDQLSVELRSATPTPGGKDPVAAEKLTDAVAARLKADGVKQKQPPGTPVTSVDVSNLEQLRDDGFVAPST